MMNSSGSITETDSIRDLIDAIMTSAYKFRVPLPVDIE